MSRNNSGGRNGSDVSSPAMSLIRPGSGMGLTRLGSLLLPGMQPLEGFTWDQKQEDDGKADPAVSKSDAENPKQLRCQS